MKTRLKLTEWGRSNFWLKLASLAVAACLAMIVHVFFSTSADNTSVLQYLVPVELKNVPADRLVIWPPPVQVELTLKGPSMFLSKIQRPVFVVPVPADAGNRFTVRLGAEHLSLPPYVEVLGIKPHEVEFTLDTRDTKVVPVVVPRIGTVSDSYKVESFKFEPDSIEISGPATEIKGIKNVETVPFDLRDLQENSEKELDLRIPGTFVRTEVKRIVATAQISSVIAEQKFDNLRVEIRSASGSGAALNPSSVSVKISGPKSVIKSLAADSVVPYVKLPPDFKGQQSLQVFVDHPEKLLVASVEPGVIAASEILPTPLPSATPTPRKKETPKTNQQKQNREAVK